MSTAEDHGHGPGGDIRVEPLHRGQARGAGALLAESHGHYPAFRHAIPDPQRRRRLLRAFMAASVRDAAEHGHALAAHGEDGPLGVALWMPPGTFPLSAARKARMTPALLLGLTAAGAASPAFLRLGSALESAHPEDPVWYLQAMGVHPRAQRRGVGGRLMAAGLDRADAAGLPCYLQTSDPANIAYYERFGFTVTQPAIETYPDGPTYIGMRRPARS
jgi:ribosomal protein S18 acetylase RimI-like enzyme